MKYVKLGVALFAIFTLTSGLALLITGWVIGGSANTKSAETKYQKLIYDQALVAADAVYSDSVAAAESDYETWYDGWLVTNPKPQTSDVAGLRTWNEKLTADSAQPMAQKDTDIKAAARVRDSAKTNAAAAYDRAVLNIKRNFTGVDNGQMFTGTYRAANILTTVRTKENGNGDWSSVTYETVLSPAGALLVSGMILTFIGGALGACMVCTYLGVWEKMAEKINQPKAPKASKAPKEPKPAKQPKHVESPDSAESVAATDETPPADAPTAEAPQPPVPPTQPSYNGQQWQS